MSSFDRFQTPFHQTAFPDPQDRECNTYSTCAGCSETIYLFEVYNREVLDIWGLAVHDDYECIKKATNARIYELEDTE
ncbi:hypothetical protein D3C73_185420 [compost metagenome]